MLFRALIVSLGYLCSDYSIYDRPRMVCLPDNVNTISFENDSGLTYGIFWQIAFALPRLTQLKCKHKRKCKQKKITFFLFLASALGFLFLFHTQPKKTLGTRLVTDACCVKLRYDSLALRLLRLHLPRVQAPHRKQRPQRFMGHFLSISWLVVFCTSFHEKSEEEEVSSKEFLVEEFLKKLFFLLLFCRSKNVFAQSWR